MSPSLAGEASLRWQGVGCDRDRYILKVNPVWDMRGELDADAAGVVFVCVTLATLLFGVDSVYCEDRVAFWVTWRFY